jgi:CHAD domain-containing protein
MDDSAAPSVLSSPVDAHVAPAAAQSDGDGAAESVPSATVSANDSATDRSSTLGPDDPMITFAYACLKRELDSLLSQQPKPGRPPTPENVHQMRIATRRLRSALRMFGKLLPPKAAERLTKDLRWFARALGDMRDLDVYAENFRAYLQEVPPERLEELGGYELHLRRARTEARDKLGELFANERYTALLAALAALVDGAPSRAALRRWRSFRIKDGVESYLDKSVKRVRKVRREMGRKTNAGDLHKLRIRTKRLRYEVEFFTPIYPTLRGLAKSAKSLQDVLGAHQDAHTASARLRAYARLLRDREPAAARATPAALDDLLKSQRRKAAEARNAFAEEWRRFEHAVDNIELRA